MSFFDPTSNTRTTLYAGELHKRGKVNQAWKRRWFVLTKTFELEYYESKNKFNDGTKNVLGSIDLLQIQKIEISHFKDIELSSIPKYIKIINDEKIKDNRSFLIYLTTAKRVYKLSANNNIAFIEWLQYLHNQLYENIICESFLEKKNENSKLFEKHYFVLNNQKHLKYYNTESRDMFLGYINLNNPSFILNLQTIDNFIELIPDHIKDLKSTFKYMLYTNDEKYFNKWCHNLRLNNYNKNEMNENDNFIIESDTENDDNNTLNLSGQNLQIIPVSLCKNISHRVTKLILTNNKLKSLEELKLFTNLNILQLDRNNLTNINDLPQLSKLTTLWLNNNNITNINALLLILKQKCPNLEYLSLLFNPLSIGMNQSENKKYRLTFVYHLPNLKFLDTASVDNKERHDSIYGCDEDDIDIDNKEIYMDSNLYRYKTNNKWSEMSLEQHEEELKNQLMNLVGQIDDSGDRLYEIN